MSATPTSPERAELRATPDDSDLLVLWDETVRGTVAILLASYTAVSPAVRREVLADAQTAICECGARLTKCVARLRGEVA